WRPDKQFDLISACFLQSPIEFQREQVLRELAGRLVPGGHLLVVSHASAPPWSAHHQNGHRTLLTAEEEIAGLSLDSTDWEVLVAEQRPRSVTSGDGEQAEIEDSVVLFGRR